MLQLLKNRLYEYFQDYLLINFYKKYIFTTKNNNNANFDK